MNNTSMMIAAVIAALGLLASSSSTADESPVAKFTAQWQEYKSTSNPPPAPHRIGAYLYTEDELVVAVFTYGIVADRAENRSFYERQKIELQYFKADKSVKQTIDLEFLESRDSYPYWDTKVQPQAPILCGVDDGNIYLLLKDDKGFIEGNIIHADLRYRLVRFVKTPSGLEMKEPPLELSRTQSTAQGTVAMGVREEDEVFVSDKQVFVNRSRTDFDAGKPFVTKNWFDVYNKKLDEVIKRTPPTDSIFLMESVRGRASTRRLDYMFEENLSGPTKEKMERVITKNLSVLVFKYPDPPITGEGP